MSDRGYRDELGAAVERLETLAEENARLRAELDRFDAPKKAAARRRSAGFCVLIFGIMFGMAFGAFSHGFSRTHRTHRHHSFSPQRTQRAVDVRTRAPELQMIRDGNDCSIPYYFDHDNVRRWKPSCVARLE